jgi:hypothetical protein
MKDRAECPQWSPERQIGLAEKTPLKRHLNFANQIGKIGDHPKAAK